MTVSVNPSEFVWTQKYRPKNIEECILPSSIKEIAKGYIEQGRIPTMLFTGSAGTGKTTLAIAMCEELGADWMMINASSQNSIDDVRTTITQFASTVSFNDSKKVTILDEADYLSPNAQAALRNLVESSASNHSIIFTCNFKNRIIDAIHSRCNIIDFKIPASEKPKLASQFMKRCEQILSKEDVEYDKKVLAELINRHFPDYRKTINELQKYAVGGKVDAGILVNLSDESFNELVSFLKEKKFNSIRKWVANNADIDSVKLFSELYNKSSDKMQPQTIPELVLILAKYSYQSAFVADHELNTMAALTEIMMNCNWK